MHNTLEELDKTIKKLEDQIKNHNGSDPANFFYMKNLYVQELKKLRRKFTHPFGYKLQVKLSGILNKLANFINKLADKISP